MIPKAPTPDLIGGWTPVFEFTAPNKKNRMISIVDDDAAVRQATEALVRSLGYRAVSFASAEEFLGSDRLQETSCLITDLQMSGMTGIELQRQLNASGQHCPVIVVTGSRDAGLRARAFAAGAVGVLGKPFSDEMLIASLDVALGADRAA